MKLSDAKKLNSGAKLKYVYPQNSTFMKHGIVVAKNSDFLFVRWSDQPMTNGQTYIPTGIVHLNGKSVMLAHIIKE
jgi:hypothetical protein